MTKKGLYKLATQPHIFLKDYVAKKQYKFEYLIPKDRVVGEYQYTIISAVYNVESYLDDYFKSIVYQILDFEKHIFLVLVDDGSTDNSANIIKKWQNKYPNNITYIKKENGGQASARNMGLDYIKTEWVTFIDPDDFLDTQYFYNIDKILSSRDSIDIGMIACKWVIFQEKSGRFSEKHPLNFRFRSGNRVFKYKNDNKFLPSSVATTLYRYSVIKENNLSFNENIKPNFEDGHFSGKYLLYMQEESIFYASGSKYFYRKRGSGTSTLDNSWANPNRFDVVIDQGYIGLLEDSLNIHGSIPTAVARLILYDIFWYFKKIINNPQSISFLDKYQKNRFKELVYKIFEKIDRDVIWNFELAGFWFYHKVGFLGMFNKEKPPYNIVYIEEYDEIKKLLKLKYFYYGDTPCEEFKVDNSYKVPVYVKSRKHYFLDEIFCKERIVWLTIDESEETLDITIDSSDTRVTLNGKQYHNGININTILDLKTKPIRVNLKNIPAHIRVIRKLAKEKSNIKKYSDAYVIMDRDNQADDNAEHFYRYLKENHNELNIYFVLRENSHDYKRLEEERFNLLSFGSLSHKIALLNAKYLISSHADKYVVDYLKPIYYSDMINYKFIFLQHGIIRDDISTWLNKKNIDLFITSMNAEYNSIAGEETNYKFTPKEVVLTGLSRHDKLLSRTEVTENVILIMPTWRNSLVGDMKGITAQRETTNEFYNSDYAKHWKSVLHSIELKEYSEKYGYKVVFFPHVNMQIYIDWFNSPLYIEVRTHKTDPILHKLFRRAKIMITDYSSVFFELAILNKAILYYQFDYDYMYGGNHSSQIGYFDFEKDGFGAVSYNEEKLFSDLKIVLENSGLPSKLYLDRIKTSFPFRDGRNRERTLHAIKSLNKPLDKRLLYNKDIIKSYLNSAIDNDNWRMVEQFLETIYNRDGLNKSELLLLIKSKRLLFNYADIEQYIDIYLNSYGLDSELQKEKLQLSISKEFFKKISIESNNNSIKDILELLTEYEHNLLINKEVVKILTFENINMWFNIKEWNIVYVLIKLIDIESIEYKDLSYFYYISLVTTNMLNRTKEAQSYLPIVKEYYHE